MELVKQNYDLKHIGSGKELFKVFITNWLLTVITLGLYYPWAKANTMQYFYQKTTLNNEAFTFSGTGKEMFKGFIKAILIIGMAYGICMFIILGLKMQIVGVLLLYAFLFALLPFVIHGTLKYRMSRSSWRGIRFGYRGQLKELIGNCLKWTLFTILTFGIYGVWYEVNLRKYIFKNIRFGNQKFEFKGEASKLFGIYFIGYFLCVFTLGIYTFWWIKDIFNFYVENTKVYNDNDEEIIFKSSLTAGEIFKVLMGNIFITIFTLGFGAPWAITRSYKLYISSIKPTGNINLNAIEQTEANYKDATGDDIGDLLEFDVI